MPLEVSLYLPFSFKLDKNFKFQGKNQKNLFLADRTQCSLVSIFDRNLKPMSLHTTSQPLLSLKNGRMYLSRIISNGSFFWDSRCVTSKTVTRKSSKKKKPNMLRVYYLRWDSDDVLWRSRVLFTATAASRQVWSRLLQQDIWGWLPLCVRPLFPRRLPPRDGKMCLPARLPGGEVVASLTNALISNR